MAQQKAPSTQSTLSVMSWRFYMTQNNAWRWEHLKADSSIVSRSASEYGQYQACLADAEEHGYARSLH